MKFHDLSEFRDIESINAFHELTGAGKVAPDDMMRYLNLRGRDNARTGSITVTSFVKLLYGTVYPFVHRGTDQVRVRKDV
mgnify:CR=1 FL=1